MRLLLLGSAVAIALVLAPWATASAQRYEQRIERARELYLEVEFDLAIEQLRAALVDPTITSYARREALMMLGTIQVAQGDLSAAARTFAEVRVRWPEFEPPRNVPPSARQVFAAVPQDELDRVERELRHRRRPARSRGAGVEVGSAGAQTRPDRRQDDRGGGGGLPIAALIGGGAVLVAAALVITVLVVSSDDRATVTVRFTD